ncbi:MAG: hypothetical protein ACODAE_09245 [Gemmatimonadota bacterium]
MAHPITHDGYALVRAFAWRGEYVTRRTFASALDRMEDADRERYAESGAIRRMAPDWPHKITPAQYLARYPDGPDADRAREMAGEVPAETPITDEDGDA